MSDGYTYCPKCAHPLSRKMRAQRPRQVCETCGFVHWDNPAPVVAALVEHEGRVVLGHNRNWPDSWFGLITGFLEREESPEEGVVREIHEELDLQTQRLTLIGVYPFAPMHQVLIAYHAETTGQITLGEELDAIKKISPEKLKPWSMGTGLAVRDWLQSRLQR